MKRLHLYYADLLGSIKKLEETRSTLYSDNSYHQHCYRLHAVLVHDGQAASGHYWVYVYCSQRKVWLRFNDITVTEASWEELTKESVGGYHNTSAYCLMYIRDLERLADSTRLFKCFIYCLKFNNFVCLPSWKCTLKHEWILLLCRH